MNFSSSMAASYGGEEVSVEWTTARTYGLSADRDIVPDNAAINLTITDPGLNYDPTSADVWIMDAANETLYFWNNGSEGDDQGQSNPKDDGTNITSSIVSKDGSQNSVFSTATLGYLCSNDCTWYNRQQWIPMVQYDVHRNW